MVDATIHPILSKKKKEYTASLSLCHRHFSPTLSSLFEFSRNFLAWNTFWSTCLHRYSKVCCKIWITPAKAPNWKLKLLHSCYLNNSCFKKIPMSVQLNMSRIEYEIVAWYEKCFTHLGCTSFSLVRSFKSCPTMPDRHMKMSFLELILDSCRMGEEEGIEA